MVVVVVSILFLKKLWFPPRERVNQMCIPHLGWACSKNKLDVSHILAVCALSSELLKKMEMTIFSGDVELKNKLESKSQSHEGWKGGHWDLPSPWARPLVLDLRLMLDQLLLVWSRDFFRGERSCSGQFVPVFEFLIYFYFYFPSIWLNFPFCSLWSSPLLR